MDPLTFCLWRFYYFFRDPPRRIPPGRNVVAPADGRILYVREVAPGHRPTPQKQGLPVSLAEWQEAQGIWAGGGTLIGIYMTPLSVHFNRAPIAGRVRRVLPRPAEGENLSMAKALARLIWRWPPYEEGSDYISRNARNTVLIDGDFPVAVIQIADRYVKEIDCHVVAGERVEKGQKYGMIRMGSQCDLFLPRAARVSLRCAAGDQVYAGESILAEYPNPCLAP